MKKYWFIMAGGVAGALLRYLIKTAPFRLGADAFPYRTLFINVTGSFILALFLTLALTVLEISPEVRLGIATGFLGAYTTFSTLCKEAVALLQDNRWPASLGYVALSLLLGLAAAYAGHILARSLFTRGRRQG